MAVCLALSRVSINWSLIFLFCSAILWFSSSSSTFSSWIFVLILSAVVAMIWLRAAKKMRQTTATTAMETNTIMLLPSSDSRRPTYAVLAPELMVLRVVLEEGEVEEVLFESESSDERASQKVLKMVKTPPVHEQGSCCEVQKKGDGSVLKDQNESESAKSELETWTPKKLPGLTRHISQNRSRSIPCACSTCTAALSTATSSPSSMNMEVKSMAALVMPESLASKP